MQDGDEEWTVDSADFNDVVDAVLTSSGIGPNRYGEELHTLCYFEGGS